MTARRNLAALLLTLFVSAAAVAQESGQQGYLSASLESNNNYYTRDKKTNADPTSDEHFGTNNYLKVDYYRGKFAVGVQLEAYYPRLLDYPSVLDGAKLTNYYITWQDANFNVTAGTFYEQFGSGLLFRTWEDRTLGLNNALMGARFAYNYNDIVAVRLVWGLPRFGMEFSETQVRGADLSFSPANLFGWKNTALSIEGSFLNRYEKISVSKSDAGGKPYQNGFSGRLNFEHSGFSLRAEYVDAGKKFVPDTNSEYLLKNGNAQLLEIGYNKGGLGINLTGRRMEWMKSEIALEVESTANLLNYIPALCTQYTYLLTTLCPYNPQTGMLTSNYYNSGEIGGQMDVFYNFRRGSTLGGKRGLKLHANFSTYYSLAEEGSAKARNLLYRDFSIDAEKQFTRAYKLSLLYSMQEFNHNYGATKATTLSHIFVADMQYKFTPRFSTRLELQYLATQEYATVEPSEKGDWMAGLLEINFAPAWSVFGSDMYNHGGKKIHYYNAGVSYAKSRTRVALGYGRYKSGYLCSGGVCRAIQAYTGANLQITTSF